jgi:hypothetical protein
LREWVKRRLLEGDAAQDGRAARPGLSAAQVELCFEHAVEDWPFDLNSALGRDGGEEPGVT